MSIEVGLRGIPDILRNDSDWNVGRGKTRTGFTDPEVYQVVRQAGTDVSFEHTMQAGRAKGGDFREIINGDRFIIVLVDVVQNAVHPL